MGKLSDDVLKWTLDINGAPARKELTDLGNSTSKLERDNKSLSSEMAKLEAHGKKGGAEWKRYEAQIKANNTTISTNKKRMEELRKEVGLNSLSASELRKEMRSLKQQMDKTSPNTQVWKDMNKQYTAMQSRLTQVRGGMAKTDGILGKLKQSAGGLLPAFGWGAVIAGAVKGAKAMFNMYIETSKARREVEKLTGLSGQPLSDFTAKVQASAQTFGKDFKEQLVGVNNFAKSMGISLDEALSKVNDGFLTGADNSGEFLDMLKEYGPQLKAAGLSADEAISLMSQQVKAGAWSDKGIDTIKEATLRLREMPTATKAALDSIGISSASLQEQLRSGSISIFDAIQMVSNRLAELPPQSSEVGRAIADIFGGPGEDAGLEFIAMLGTAELSLDKLKAGVGENAQAQEKLLKANTKLKLAWGELMGTGTGTLDAIKAFSIDLVATGISGISKGLAGVRDWFIELYNESLPVRAGIQYMLASWETGFGVVKTALSGFWEQLKLGGKLIKSVLTFDLSGIKEAFKDFGNNMKETVVNNARNIAESWKSAWNETLDGKLEPVKQVVEIDPVIKTNSSTSEPVNQTGSVRTNEAPAVLEGIMSELYFRTQEIEALKIVEDEWLRYQQGLADREMQISKDKIDQWNKEVEEKRAVHSAIIGLAGQAIDALIQLAGQESAIGKALFFLNQARAVSEIIFNTGIANAKAVAASPLTFGQPWVGINTATAGVSIASVLAQTIASTTGGGVKKSQGEATGYATGGFTRGEAMYIAGEKGEEWISPNWMLNSPATRPVIDWLEKMRTHRLVLPSPIKPSVMMSGNSIPHSVGTDQSVQSSNAILEKIDATLTNLNSELKRGIMAKAYINKWGSGGIDEALQDISRFKKKIYKKS